MGGKKVPMNRHAAEANERKSEVSPTCTVLCNTNRIHCVDATFPLRVHLIHPPTLPQAKSNAKEATSRKAENEYVVVQGTQSRR